MYRTWKYIWVHFDNRVLYEDLYPCEYFTWILTAFNVIYNEILLDKTYILSCVKDTQMSNKNLKSRCVRMVLTRQEIKIEIYPTLDYDQFLWSNLISSFLYLETLSLPFFDLYDTPIKISKVRFLCMTIITVRSYTTVNYSLQLFFETWDSCNPIV